MWERVFDPPALLFFGVAAGFAFLAGVLVGRRRRERASAILGRAGEAAVLAALGGVLARAFISLLLSWGNDTPAAALTVGWAFFLWPGAVDALPALLRLQPIFTPAVLSWTAAGVGAFVGMMDGIGRIHAWRGPGALTFVLDVTWGLAGSTNGCLVHLANFAWADRKDEARSGAHRYTNGFRVKKGYALTLGSVMTNLPAHAGNLVRHELVHVAQNRLFGPLYTLTYLGWMAAMLLPALVAGLVKGTPGRTVEDWCYVNNPWEAWAYTRGGWRDPARVWGRRTQAVVSGVFFLGVLAASAWVVWVVWFR